MPDIYTELRRDWQGAEHAAREAAGWFSRHHQTPAGQPVTITAAPAARTTEETLMSLLDTITEDVKKDLTDGVAYVKEFASRLEAASPAIISTAEKLGGSTVGALVEAVAGKVLPADVEAELVAIVKRYVATWGAEAGTMATATAGTDSAAQAAPVVATPAQ